MSFHTETNAAQIRRDLARNPALRSSLGPHLLVDFNCLPIARPARHHPRPNRSTKPASTGRAHPKAATSSPTPPPAPRSVIAIAYAFWRIQAQPIAVAAPAPLDRAARRRAARASVVHTTRVVMLRRTSPIADHGDGEAKWHYRVRFVVRGHWRRLVDKHGNPYRIWIHAHIRPVDRTNCVSYRFGEGQARRCFLGSIWRRTRGRGWFWLGASRLKVDRGGPDRLCPRNGRRQLALGRGRRRRSGRPAGQRVSA